LKIKTIFLKGILVLVPLLFHPSVSAGEANLKIADFTDNGREEVCLENGFFRLLIEPDFGAQGISLIDKSTGKELVLNEGKEGGLFIDHDFRQSWPGEFFRAKYDYKIIDKGPEKVTVEFSRRAAGRWRKQDIVFLKDIIIKKRITVFADKPIIKVTLKFINPTREDKSITYWLQNLVSAAGDADKDYYYRPYPGGISRVTNRDNGEDWVRSPTAGWTGILNPQEKRGIVFLMDYNYLDTLYNCLSSSTTTEWMYAKVGIPPGSSWQTEVKLVLTREFTDYTYASDKIIAGLVIKEKDKKLFLAHQLAAVEGKIPSAKVQTTYVNLGEKPRMFYDTTRAIMVKEEGKEEEKDLGYFKLNNIGFQPVVTELTIPDITPGQKVIRVEVSSGGFRQFYEKPFIVGEIEPFYEKTPPEKHKVFLKPGKITVKKDGKLDVLLLRSSLTLNTQRWRIEEILKGKGINVKTAVYNYVGWKEAGEIEGFPTGYSDLLSYDVLIIQAGMHALGDAGQEMVKDFVEAGGGLLVLGGYYSYGKSRVRGERIEEILPVELLSPWDLKESRVSTIRKVKNSPMIEGLPWRKKPEVIWYQQIRPGKGAQTILEIDGKPLLVSGSFGKGKVVCFTGTILGAKSKVTDKVFWKWAGYEDFLIKLITYLTGGKI